jgi:hypothetical protein
MNTWMPIVFAKGSRSILFAIFTIWRAFMSYQYIPPLSEDEKRELTRALVKDMIFFECDNSKGQIERYTEALHDIWTSSPEPQLGEKT